MKARMLKVAAYLPALVVMLSVLQGCAVGRYVHDRVNDALDIGEGGITVSKTPQFGLYWNSLDILTAGYSDFDGYLIGWGGRRLGVTRLRNKCAGLIISREEVAWGDYDENDPDAVRKRYGGLAGVPGLLGGMAKDGHALDSPACVHFFPHIGYVGIAWNLRWGQILDFVVGFTTIDLGQDDSLYREKSAPKEKTDEVKPASNPPRKEPASRPTAKAEPTAAASIPPASAPSAVPKPPATPTPPAASGRIHLVQKGDTLSGISRKYFGAPNRWRDIHDANKSVVSDPGRLEPGMRLVLPEK